MFLEKDIEDLIYNSLTDKNKLRERGLYGPNFYKKFYRQVYLGEYGRLDLVGIRYRPEFQIPRAKKTVHVGVFEIKKGEIDYNAFIQAVRYCKGIEQYLKKYNLEGDFHIFLIGTSICMGDFCYLTDFVNNLSIYTVKLDLDQGIIFKKEHGFRLKNPGQIIKPEIHADVRNYITDTIRNEKKITTF